MAAEIICPPSLKDWAQAAARRSMRASCVYLRGASQCFSTTVRLYDCTPRRLHDFMAARLSRRRSLGSMSQPGATWMIGAISPCCSMTAGRPQSGGCREAWGHAVARDAAPSACLGATDWTATPRTGWSRAVKSVMSRPSRGANDGKRRRRCHAAPCENEKQSGTQLISDCLSFRRLRSSASAASTFLQGGVQS